jgi:DNA-binding NarL/FixJ family response regulator
MEPNNSQFSILNSQFKKFSTLNSQLISVAIVDDHKVVVEGLERLINESGIAKVIGKAYTAAACWSVLAEQTPDVLLLDVGLPDGNGADLCPEIKQRYPDLHILMLTSYAEYAVITQSLENGAAGYVLKNAMAEEILEGIQVVASGKRFLCEEVDLLLKNRSDNAVVLTRQERKLLGLVVEGCSNAEIADRMCLGYETIKSYRKNLILKLNAHNTALLVKMAIEQKLV